MDVDFFSSIWNVANASSTAVAGSGDTQAAEKILPLAYEELRRMASGRMARERADHTLQPTALVHEAWLRVTSPDGEMRTWQSRGQFFAAVAEAMRRILIDSARRKACHKHGGNLERTGLDDKAFSPESPPDGILALNDALTKLEAVHPEFARIVKLRYFAGMNTSETAAALETSPSTVDRAWKSAKAWLHREMSRCMD